MTQNIKKVCTQEIVKKIGVFMASSTVFLSETGIFVPNDEYHYSLGPLPCSLLPCQRFYRPLLLHHQYINTVVNELKTVDDISELL